MLRSFLLITFRILWRNKVTSFVNIFGLSVGITAFIFIMLYVYHETSYDKFNEKYDRIYRVEADDYAKLPYTAGLLLKDRLPEVEDFALMADGGTQLFAHTPDDDPENPIQIEFNFYWANPSVFNVFTLPFVQGDPNTALKNPLTAVLTESTARKLFGTANPMNKTIEFKNHQFVITGIIKDVERSHMEIDALLSHESLERVFPGSYKNIRTIEHNTFIWSGTYLLLSTSKENQFESRVNDVLAEYNNGINISVIFKKFHARPLRDIYFNGNVHNLSYGLHGNAKMIQVLIALGVFLLVLAVINYVNLTTARSTTRVKEVAIKRVSGSSAGQMRYQLILESCFVTLVSLVAAVTLVQLLLPNFNVLANTQINTADFNRPVIWGLVLGGCMLLGILAGLYPSFYLTAVQPLRLIKGEGLKGSSGSFFRSMLMTFQFALSVIMIVAILVNARQLNYTRTADLGFIKDHILSIRTPNGGPDVIVNRNSFKQRLISKGLDKVTFCSGAPGYEEGSLPMHELNGQKITAKYFVADSDFLKVMGIEVVKGRGFSAKFPADQFKWIPHTRVGGVLLNETAVREFGLENPIGQVFYQADSTRHMTEVVGVVKDFHFRSFHDKIEPLSIGWWGAPREIVMIKLPANDIAASIRKIEKEWKEVFGQFPFAYKFLDENFDQQYKADEQLAKVISYFTCIAVIIACLGLFALSSFMVSRRVKEIGVRKVLGASVGTIYSMLSWDFLKWILVAIVIATPVAWYLMKMWLSTFAYHIELGIDVFVIAALIAIGIALLTVTGQSLKVARANPIDSLRYE
jgi:putative ABC transport system permease protein